MPCAYGPSTGIPSSASVAPGNQSGDGSIACAHRAIATRRRALGARRLNHRVLQGLVLSAAIAFAARRARLETLIAKLSTSRIDISALVPFATWDELTAARAEPASAGAGEDAEAVEGVMLKRRDAPYLPGRPKGMLSRRIFSSFPFFSITVRAL